jgi:hypothetical protein
VFAYYDPVEEKPFNAEPHRTGHETPDRTNVIVLNRING